LSRALLLLLAPILAACTLARPAANPTAFDFGLSPKPVAIDERLPGALAVAPVHAPTPLAGTGIVYRLAYENAARPEIYSQSRWAAPPAELLTQRLQQRLESITEGGVTGGSDNVAADYLLQVDLEEFSQVFDAPNKSRAVVQVRASLIDPKKNALVAQDNFRAERPAASDAAGAARGLREATDKVLDRLAQWLVGSVKVKGARS
jgi:cholesterol transport system auxiliary component